jgi:hypothetical protein
MKSGSDREPLSEPGYREGTSIVGQTTATASETVAGANSVVSSSDPIAPTSEAGSRIDPTASAGQARGYATDMKMALVATADGGQPTVANLEQASAALSDAGTLSGLDDADKNGTDDDAKVTITVGTDQACLAYQNAAWAVVDGKC